MTWELDHRSNDGIEVGLWWDSESDRLTVSIVDLRGAETFELEVGGADPLDVFQHPYAYARSG